MPTGSANVKIYEYPKCSTCVKALAFLTARKVNFSKHDITQTPPSKAELKKMIDIYGGDFKKLFNTSGIQYRELKISEKIPQMSEKQAIDLLAGNGRLIKRPFVLAGDQGVVGFREEAWKKLF